MFYFIEHDSIILFSASIMCQTLGIYRWADIIIDRYYKAIGRTIILVRCWQMQLEAQHVMAARGYELESENDWSVMSQMEDGLSSLLLYFSEVLCNEKNNEVSGKTWLSLTLAKSEQNEKVYFIERILQKKKKKDLSPSWFPPRGHNRWWVQFVRQHL